MILTPRIDDAIKLAAHLHRHQTRIDKNSTPYITHLVSVAIIISEVTDDEDIIIAGLMHDSLEDVPHYTYTNLVEDCGERVASIVKHVTEPLDANKEASEQLPWLTRKEAYLENLQAGGIESAIVSAADKIHNTETMLRDTAKEPGAFLARFHSSLTNRVWFHEKTLEVLQQKLGKDHILIQKLTRSVEKLRTLAATQ